MPIFINNNNSILITSYKVMYSTFCSQKNLKQSPGIFSLLLNKFKSRKARICCLLVRNPYTRLESFFKDKFRQVVESPEKNKEWQYCQKIFFTYLGLDDSMSSEEIRSKLLSTSFDDFIAILPYIYHLDGHLQPQFYNKKLILVKWKLKIAIPLHFTKVYKMECQNDLNEMATIFDLDLRTIKNSTATINEKIIWNEKSKNIVQQIYFKDFRDFNYSFDHKNKKGCDQSGVWQKIRYPLWVKVRTFA